MLASKLIALAAPKSRSSVALHVVFNHLVLTLWRDILRSNDMTSRDSGLRDGCGLRLSPTSTVYVPHAAHSRKGEDRPLKGDQNPPVNGITSISWLWDRIRERLPKRCRVQLLD